MKINNKIVFCSLVIGALGSSSAFAINQRTREEEDAAAGVRFYEPTSCSLHDALNPNGTTGQTTDGLSPLQANWVDKWHETAQELSIEFGIPWEAVMAQSIVESASGTSYYATARNNFFGLGAVDSNPDNAYSFESPEAGWRGYYEFIQRNSSLYSAHGVFAEPTITNPYKYVEAIKAAGYATASDYVETVTRYVGFIEERSKTLSWSSSADLAKAYPEMLEHAKENQKGNGSTSYSSDLSNDKCDCSSDGNASGLRWVDGYLVTGTVSGYSRTNIIGTMDEYKISSYGYGLSFTTQSPKNPTQKGADKIIIRTVEPNGISSGNIVDALALYPNGDFPHFVIDIKNARMYQFFSTEVASAAMGDSSRESGIVVDVVGYTSESNKESSWYLLDQKAYTDTNWLYLANLLRAIHEKDGIELKGDGEIWDKLSTYLVNLSDSSAIKCSSLDDAEQSMELREARNIARFFNSSKVTVDSYMLPLNTKNNDASFVAYFVQRFTNIGKVQRDWGYGRDTAYLLNQEYPEFGVGTDPKPLAVFSVDDATTTCRSENCGHTGIIVGIYNGNITTIEAAYPSTKATVMTRPIDYFTNSIHPYQFTYLAENINETELSQGKLGK